MTLDEMAEKAAAEAWCGRVAYREYKIGNLSATDMQLVARIADAIKHVATEHAENALRQAAIAVNAVQDHLPKDRKEDGSFDYVAAYHHPVARKIWHACRQAVIDLIPEKKSPSLKENGE